MDKLIAHNGGMPLELNDLIFIQDSFQDSFKGLFHEFSLLKSGNVILSGCKIARMSNGDYSLSEGYATLNYEVLYVPPVVVPFKITTLILDVNYNPAGRDTFYNGQVRDTYEVRTLKPSPQQALPSFYVLMSDDNRLTHLLPKVMKDNWALTDFVGEKYFIKSSDLVGGATLNSNTPAFLIKKSGVVRFYGAINVPPNIGAGTRILKLPSAFQMSGSASAYANVYLCSYGNAIVRMGVSNDALTYMDKPLVGSINGYGISLNQISYDID